MGLRLQTGWILGPSSQTSGRPGEGALHTRLEFEHATKNQALELHRISHPSHPGLPDKPEKLRHYCSPCLPHVSSGRSGRFHTKKTAWWSWPWISGWWNAKETPLWSVKSNVNLKSGPIEAVFAVAQTLAEHFALFPQLRSKAERGYRLFTRTAATPEEARIPELHASMSPWRARQTVMLECLRHLEYNLMEIGHGDDVEFCAPSASCYPPHALGRQNVFTSANRRTLGQDREGFAGTGPHAWSDSGTATFCSMTH